MLQHQFYHMTRIEPKNEDKAYMMVTFAGGLRGPETLERRLF